jgi:NADPH2:quinone reductase
MTKAFRFHKLGGPEVLQLEDVDLGAPGLGEVLIRQSAIGVNFRDIYRRTGIHAVEGFPAAMGVEGAGMIEAVGEGVEGLAPGQRVVAQGAPDGAYAEARIVPAWRVMALPDDVDERDAAAMMVKGLTARNLLKRCYPVKPGDTILVHAAAGGVGMIMCQWAKHLGATVIGTVGTEAKAEAARAHGCDHTIIYTREDFAPRVREITNGEGVHAVYDSIGKDTFEGSLACLRPLGLMAQFGEASGEPPLVSPRTLGTLGSVYLTHPSLPHYTSTREDFETSANDLFEVVGAGIVKIAIDRTYPLADAAQAHIDLAARRTIGSVVLLTE